MMMILNILTFWAKFSITNLKKLGKKRNGKLVKDLKTLWHEINCTLSVEYKCTLFRITLTQGPYDSLPVQ
jgi:hypothetical protein